jgi:peptide deformylase
MKKGKRGHNMETLKILTYPDKFLSEPTKPVENIDEKIQNLVKDMASIMYQAPGVGLAAIQVGINKSLLVYDVSPRDEKRSLQVLINPRIVESEGTTISEGEGCLSVPDFRANVKRAASVLIEGFDNKEKPLRIEAQGLLAIVLQHEIDHLNGILFIDRISPLKRGMYKRRVKKKLKK